MMWERIWKKTKIIGIVRQAFLVQITIDQKNYRTPNVLNVWIT